jgi:hypothetical protein
VGNVSGGKQRMLSSHMKANSITTDGGDTIAFPEGMIVTDIVRNRAVVLANNKISASNNKPKIPIKRASAQEEDAASGSVGNVSNVPSQKTAKKKKRTKAKKKVRAPMYVAPVNLSPGVPYYLHGKTKYHEIPYSHKTTFQLIRKEEAVPVQKEERVWVLPGPVKTPTRNHESILLEYGFDHNEQVLVNVLGRYSRVVQWMNLNTGEQYEVKTEGTDPDNRPLNDLNHVASVVVDSVGVGGQQHQKKEIWLPCGFHNDRIGKEQSSNYVRIVDLETMEVSYGPKLPYSGGACGAATIEAIPGEPPLICAFGGTDGNHDTGEY